MTGKFSSVMRALACTALFLAFSPVLIVKCGVMGQSEFILALEIFLVVLTGLAGMLFSFCFYGFSALRPVLFKIICILSVVLPLFIFAGILYLIRDFSLATLIPVGIVGAAVYYIGAGMYFRDYGKILGAVFIPICICSSVLAGAVLFLTDATLDGTPMLIVLIMIFALNSIVNNQANIDALMNRRHYDMKSLPKNIRLFNLGLLAVLFAFVLVLLLLRDYIVALLKLIFSSLMRVINSVMNFLALLYENVFSGGEDVIAEEEGIIAGDESALNETTANILLAIMIVVLAVIIFRKRREIFTAIKSGILYLIRIISDFFARSSSHAEAVSQYYVDTEEYIEIAKPYSEKKHRKMLKKEYRNYMKMKNSDEKYRKGYALALAFVGKNASPADTPNEICQRLSGEYADVVPVTENYNALRYGGEGYGGDFSEMDAFLSQLIRKR
ncbi:MAG: hypothetical protein E7507_00560 [Ruminococcus sp.]|nr:hypothetical protein [Ruminococcus sp.]